MAKVTGSSNKWIFIFSVLLIIVITLGWFMMKDLTGLWNSNSSSSSTDTSSDEELSPPSSPLRASSSSSSSTHHIDELPPQPRTRPPKASVKKFIPSSSSTWNNSSPRAIDTFRKSRHEKYSSGEYQRQHLHRNKKLNLKSEEGKMISGLRQVTEPLKCKKSSSLEKSPYLLEKYGPVDENWCEIKSSLTSQWEDDLFNYTTIFDTGTTYFDYPSSSDGADWPYYTCPIKHKIVCNNNNDKNNQKNKRNRHAQKPSKALVIYIVSSGTHPYQLHQESMNLDFFIKHGYVPANTPTALFDSVDFVFAKIQLAGEGTQNQFRECGSLSDAVNDEERKKYSNVKFMMIPKVPCDLCAHSYIMNKLGLFDMKKEQDKVRNHEFRYSSTFDAQSNRSLHEVLKQLFVKKQSTQQRQEETLPQNDRKSKIEAELRRRERQKEVTDADDRNENNKEQQQYSQIFMMNSGVRGPFFSSADDDDDDEYNENNKNEKQKTAKNVKSEPKTTWLDFAAMGGRRKIPNPRSGFFDDNFIPKNAEDKDEDCPIHVSVSSSISFERSLHHQSYFLSMPIRIMKERIFTLFANVCPFTGARNPARDKTYCVNKGEVATGKAVLGKFGPDTALPSSSSFSALSSAMYSLSKQYYIQNLKSDAERKRKLYYHPQKNPAYSWLDGCKSVFLKDGGGSFMMKDLPGNSLNAIDKLTKGANHHWRMMMMMNMNKKKRSSSTNERGRKRNDGDGDGGDGNDDVLWDVDSIQRMFAYYGCTWKF